MNTQAILALAFFVPQSSLIIFPVCIPRVYILSGVPLEILALEHWVPGVSFRQDTPKFKNQKQFQEILSTTDATANLYILRATKDRLNLRVKRLDIDYWEKKSHT